MASDYKARYCKICGLVQNPGFATDKVCNPNNREHKAYRAGLEAAAVIVETSGYRSNGAASYEHIAAKIRARIGQGK